MKRWLVFVLWATPLGVAPGGASAQRALTRTSGVVGGGWYAISTGLAELLREKADLDVKVLPGGGAQNPVLVGKGYLEIRLGLPPLLGAVTRGDDPYRGKRFENLRGLATRRPPTRARTSSRRRALLPREGLAEVTGV